MINILNGDCREVLKTLPSAYFNACVTSPPYFGLRDYSTGDKQIGLEETPEEFVENLVNVFREVWRVLRDDGTLWLNLGDSYYNYRPGRGQSLTKQSVSTTKQDLPQKCARRANKLIGLKEKDLIGIPWRVAFALQADGWYLRQDIIWHKPNPMPESVQDRCTKSHEYIFLFTKRPKYYFDNHAISEEANYQGVMRGGSTAQYEQNNFGGDNKEYSRRNKRSVWSVGPATFKEAHFAVFPTELIEPCIKAGCPKDGYVLDPFGGAGTTGIVADRLGRSATLIELNNDYADLTNKRLIKDAGMFANINTKF